MKKEIELNLRNVRESMFYLYNGKFLMYWVNWYLSREKEGEVVFFGSMCEVLKGWVGFYFLLIGSSFLVGFGGKSLKRILVFFEFGGFFGVDLFFYIVSILIFV